MTTGNAAQAFINVGERTNVTGSAKFRKLIEANDYHGGARCRAPAGRERRADHRRQHGRRPARWREGDGHVPEPDRGRAGHRPRADHDRQLQVEGDRGRPEVRAGQGDRQFDLDEGRRRRSSSSRPRRCCATARPSWSWRSTSKGQADTAERKVEICTRAYELLTDKVGFPPEDIIFDPNIFAVATGIEEHNNYAVDFIEATRLIKRNLPRVHVSGGVSNLSFSFRGNEPVREAMHSVFLYHAIKRRHGHGHRQRRPARRSTTTSIPNCASVCEDVILNRRADATDRLLEIAERYRRAERRRSAEEGPLLAREAGRRTG